MEGVCREMRGVEVERAAKAAVVKRVGRCIVCCLERGGCKRQG